MCVLRGLQKSCFYVTILIHKIWVFGMAEQIFAGMSFGLSWHHLLKVSLQVFPVFTVLSINKHFYGHQFSASSKLKQEFQKKHPLH